VPESLICPLTSGNAMVTRPNVLDDLARFGVSTWLKAWRRPTPATSPRRRQIVGWSGAGQG
jgi:hypothetical protein